MGSLIKAIVIKHMSRKAEAASGSMTLVTLSVAACQCAMLHSAAGSATSAICWEGEGPGPPLGGLLWPSAADAVQRGGDSYLHATHASSVIVRLAMGGACTASEPWFASALADPPAGAAGSALGSAGSLKVTLRPGMQRLSPLSCPWHADERRVRASVLMVGTASVPQSYDARRARAARNFKEACKSPSKAGGVDRGALGRGTASASARGCGCCGPSTSAADGGEERPGSAVRFWPRPSSRLPVPAQGAACRPLRESRRALKLFVRDTCSGQPDGVPRLLDDCAALTAASAAGGWRGA